MSFWKLFSSEKDYEVLKFLLRRHPLTFIPRIFLFVLLLATPLVVRWLWGKLFPESLLSATSQVLVTISISAFYLFALVFFLTQFVDYFLDVWMVTNERILDIQLNGLFARTVAETRLFRVQDVTSDVKGFFATMFNYGNVYVQTAGNKERFVFRNIPNPVYIAQQITQLVEADRPYHTDGNGKMNLETGMHVDTTDPHTGPGVSTSPV